MSKQRHIIARTVIELDTQQLGDVWSLQSDVSQLFQQQGVEAIAELFDQLVEEGEIVRLERVEVDIGDLDSRFFADEFIHKLQTALRETLGDRLTDLSLGIPTAKSIHNSENSDWEMFIYFLQYGRFPWWCPVRDWQEWLSCWLDAMQINTNQQEKLRQLLRHHPPTQQRLIEQFPESFRHQLVLKLQPTWINWHHLLTQAKQIIQSWVWVMRLDNSARLHLEKQAWLLLLREIDADSTSTRAFPTTWTHNWLTQLMQFWHLNQAKHQTPTFPSVTPQPITQRLRTILTAVPESEQSLWLTALEQVLNLTSRLSNNSDTTYPLPGESQEQTEPLRPNLQSGDNRDNHTPNLQRDGEVLLHFLQYGRLPWGEISADWHIKWENTIQTEKSWYLPLRKLLRNNPTAQQRLVTQLPEKLRYQLVQQLQPNWTNWYKLLTQAREIIQSCNLSNYTNQQLIDQAWRLLLAEMTSENPPPTFPAATWTRNWLTQLLQTPELNRLIPTSDPKEQASVNQTPYQHLHTIITTLPIAEHPPWLTALEQVLSNTSKNTPTVPTNWREDPSQTGKNSILSTAEATAGLYITQAGLVLLHPFIPFYFQAIGLLNNELFPDESAQQTAIYLLYYLATKQTDTPESELVLPKLLCGCPLNQPVARGLDLPDAALEEGERLLQTVINYWQVLKSTSPDGLREGFLQRQGKLTLTGDGNWKLQVEQQAIDILLGSLPWGVSLVTLPWIEGILMVEWV